MTTFISELEKYADLEKAYQNKYPNAQPLGNYYQYFGVEGLLDILNEAAGREIVFYVEPSTEQCIYSFQ